jgi:hypothetical protein
MIKVLRIKGLGLWGLGIGFRIEGLGLRNESLEFRI